MKAENWIIAAGLAFTVMVLFAALLPDDTFDGSARMSSKFLEKGTAVVMGTGDAQTAAAPQQRQNTQAMTGMVPFTKAKTDRFEGKVVRVISLGNDTGWGQLRVWVDAGGGGTSREVSVAPDWYLMHLGCTITKGARVKGSAFTFGKKLPDSELYAKNITIDGKTCDLRNDEGFALWSNRLR